jgi:hypothetical protein
MMIKRAVKEGRQLQGTDERIAYTLTTTPWGTSPGSLVVKIFDITAGTASTLRVDKTTTMLSGAASALGDVITTPLVIGLTPGQLYRMEIQFVCAGNTFEAYVDILAEQ